MLTAPAGCFFSGRVGGCSIMSYRTRQGLTETETLGMTSADAAVWGRVMSTVPWSLGLKFFAQSAAMWRMLGVSITIWSKGLRSSHPTRGRFVPWRGDLFSDREEPSRCGPRLLQESNSVFHITSRKITEKVCSLPVFFHCMVPIFHFIRESIWLQKKHFSSLDSNECSFKLASCHINVNVKQMRGASECVNSGVSSVVGGVIFCLRGATFFDACLPTCIPP